MLEGGSGWQTAEELIAAAVEERTNLHNLARGQQVAELVALEAEKALEQKYGTELWAEIRQPAFDQLRANDPSADVWDSPSRFTSALDYASRIVLEKQYAEEQKANGPEAQWERIKANSPSPYSDHMTRRDAGL